MKKFILFFQISFWSAGLLAQTFPIAAENADCSHPVVLKDTVYGPTDSPQGYGATREFFANGNHNAQYFPEETASVWYSFHAPGDGWLTLDIIPVDVKEDCDFMLYRIDDTRDLCNRIRSKSLKPVRSCISRNDPASGSKTGLSKKALHDFIPPGPGPSYSKALPVKEGENFLMVVNNVSVQPKGHTLILHFLSAESSDLKADEFQLKITSRDAASKKTVKADFLITEPGRDDTDTLPVYKAKDVGAVTCKLKKQPTYKIEVTAPGYLSFSQRVSCPLDLKALSVNADLIRLEAGKSINFENIYFEAGTDIFLPSAGPALQSLFSTMQRHPKLKIAVYGHVNAPGQPNTEFHQTLSEKRAEAVYNYLVEKGIEKERMTHQGFGNTRMVYPQAQFEEYAAKNRRVEIIVISVE